jgi:hypothetical protein
MAPDDETITTDQSNRMVVEATLGKEETSIPGEYAQKYYQAIKDQVDDMKAKGYMPLPHGDD